MFRHFVLLCVALIPTLTSASTPLPRAEAFPRTHPVAERVVTASLPASPGADDPFWVQDGAGPQSSTTELVVLNLDDDRVEAYYSPDSGTSFQPPVVVPTAGRRVVGRPAVSGHAMELHLALPVEDPGGDVGIVHTRSTDLGRTWSAADVVVGQGDPTHGTDLAEISHHGSTVAIAYRETRGDDPYVVVSGDSGATWAAPVRINSAVPDGDGQPLGLAVHVDRIAGLVHAAFTEARGGSQRVFYTRSVDGGATFEAERSFETLLPAGVGDDSISPSLESSVDNPFVPGFENDALFVTFYDRSANPLDFVLVFRSVDFGVSWTLARGDNVPVSRERLVPRTHCSLEFPACLAAIVDGAGDLQTWFNSNPAAAFFGTRVTVASGVDSVEASFTDAVNGSASLTWISNDADGYVGQLSDVWTSSTSIGNWAFWGSPASHVNAGPVGVATTTLAPGATASADNRWLYAYGSTVTSPDASTDALFNSRLSAAFDGERRLDTDGADRDPAVGTVTAVAAEPGGSSRVYTAIAVNLADDYREIRVAVSEDAGASVARIERASGSTGDEAVRAPRLAAVGAGRAWTAFAAVDAATCSPGPCTTDLRLARTIDAGQSWLPEATLGTLTDDGFALRAVNGGAGADVVQAAWADGGAVRFRASGDGGAFFAPELTVTAAGGDVSDVELCEADGTLWALWLEPDTQGSFATSAVAASRDGGASFGAAVRLLADGVSGGVRGHTLDCFTDTLGGTRYAAVHMTDERSGTAGATGVVLVESGGLPTVLGPFATDAAAASRASAAGVACPSPQSGPGSCRYLVEEDVDPSIETTDRVVLREVDSSGVVGATVTLTDDAPRPTSTSRAATLIDDGAARLWVGWLDASAGRDELVARHSADGGDTFGALYRLSTVMPQGAFESRHDVVRGTAALDGRAHFAWAARRSSSSATALTAAWDANDFDADGTDAALDCADADPTVANAPLPLAGLTTGDDSGGTFVGWSPQPADVAYDVVRGSLSALRSSGGFAAATCVADDHPTATLLDPQADPPPGDGWYWLGRADNACGLSSYGDSTLATDPRDALDAAGPCGP